ncbi:MAG: lactate utilization protein [Planctomycetes bacterium]|nr:lactate utilization protein [Planctomycetota bacterium]
MSADLAERFTAVLTRVFGRCETVADLPAATARVQELIEELDATVLAGSDAPEVTTVLAALPGGGTRLPHDAPREQLLAADIGLTTAQLGIAETGTLVLESGREQHRLVSLLPKVHIALLPRSRLVGSLVDAFAHLSPSGGPPRARAITFITGPSRTADIELELVVGVHGPKQLIVLILDTL